MSLFGGDNKKLSEMTIKNPREAFKDVLKVTSGASIARELPYDIFYQVIAFRGVVDGLGTSTIVANTALAIAETNLTVCVIDTSILQPVQDILLHTNVESIEEKDRLDWFDMPYTKKSPLHVSRLNGNISVLSFAGKKRGIVDILSTNDATQLVDIALAELHNKFDIILIDSCHEMTSVNIAALQQAQHIIQVWSDTPQVTRNIDNFITNCVTLSVPLDKMRFVITNKVTPDLIGSNSDELINQYRLTKLASMRCSDKVQYVTAMGRQLWQMESVEPEIAEFTDMIIEVACHILNVERGNEAKGTFTANDVDEGKIKGTLRHKNKEKEKSMPPIITTLSDADSSLVGDPSKLTSPVYDVKFNQEEQQRIDKARKSVTKDDIKDMDSDGDIDADDLFAAQEEAADAEREKIIAEKKAISDNFSKLGVSIDSSTKNTKKKKGFFGKEN